MVRKLTVILILVLAGLAVVTSSFARDVHVRGYTRKGGFVLASFASYDKSHFEGAQTHRTSRSYALGISAETAS